jgi:hypothetical protein
LKGGQKKSFLPSPPLYSTLPSAFLLCGLFSMAPTAKSSFPVLHNKRLFVVLFLFPAVVWVTTQTYGAHAIFLLSYRIEGLLALLSTLWAGRSSVVSCCCVGVVVCRCWVWCLVLVLVLLVCFFFFPRHCVSYLRVH